MTDAYLVTVMLTLLGIGGLIGSGLTLLAFRRRELLQHRERLRLEGQSEGTSQQAQGPLDQLLTRFDSLEERVDFTEQMMLDRPTQRGSKPDHG